MPRPQTLSYALNRKTDKLLSAHKKRGADMAFMIPVGTITALLLSYFVANMNRFMDGWFSLAGNANASALLTPLEVTYLKVLFLSSIIFGCLYAMWSKHNEKYKKYKDEVLEILEVNVCHHKGFCGCKDEYCK
jgi:undecaprenyl pyrophosphate phosphatase UppP